MRELAICIVQHDLPELTENCLNFLQDSTTGARYCIIDNGSEIPAKESFPDATIIRRETNDPWSLLCNETAKTLEYDYIAFLNNDMWFPFDLFRPAVSRMKHNPLVKACGCRTINRLGNVKELYGYVAGDGSMHPREDSRKGWLDLQSIPYASSVYVMERETFLALGGYDERLIWGYEDIDYVWRLFQAGFVESVYNDESAIHEGGRTKMHIWGMKARFIYQDNETYFKNKWKDVLETLPERIGRP